MKILDIEDIFLELRDSNHQVTHFTTNPDDDNYQFSDEFIIFKLGDSGYSLDGKSIKVFNLYSINEELERFGEICNINNIKYRIITSDGEFTLNISDKISNLSSINEEDILSKTHLHLKNTSGKKGYIDIENVKFCSCQIMKG